MIFSNVKSKFLKALDGMESGHLRLSLPDGQEYEFGGKNHGPSADLRLHDWKVVRNLLLNGDIGFADDYKLGRWETKNLTDLISLALLNENLTHKYIHGGFSAYILAKIANIANMNTLRGSRRNISAHYDLGNDFYALWLDSSMTYSSAIYAYDGQPLQSAQMTKYDRILDNMNLSSGKILEIGCGWGGFMERASQKGDFAIKGLTLSQQQKKYADQRLNGMGEVALQDYRIEQGVYDKIISIEMFEAVGEKYWDAYFQKIASALKKGGSAFVQTITIADDRFENYRKNGDFIRQFIFPGGMLPSPSVFAARAQKAGLQIIEKFEFAHSYAKTLDVWLKNFNDKHAQIQNLGYDEKFMRLWKFYLSACIAGFQTGRTNVMQVELRHA